MASTISHDLRHPLTTILAYAEFQSEGNLEHSQRKAMYDEIRASVDRMAELISSLLEFSKGQEAPSVHPWRCGGSPGTHDELGPTSPRIQRRPNHRGERRGYRTDGLTLRSSTGPFTTFCKMPARLFPRIPGKSKSRRGGGRSCGVSLTDNGCGIPDSIREDVFEPFVTYGKEKARGSDWRLFKRSSAITAGK